jgi:hypothetical protein
VPIRAVIAARADRAKSLADESWKISSQEASKVVTDA